MAHKLTTCTFCGVGCGLYLETSGNQIVGAYPSVSHPSNQGRICVRGWYVHEVASSPDRLKHPLLRKNGQLQEVSWDEALGFVAGKMKAIRDEHGPDALGFLNSPRCSNEESYLLQKFARAVIGTNNVHHGTGVYSNNAINVLLDMIGVPASTNSIAELAQSKVIVVDGVDLAKRMPTIGGAVIRAKLNGARLIVSPRVLTSSCKSSRERKRCSTARWPRSLWIAGSWIWDSSKHGAATTQLFWPAFMNTICSGWPRAAG